MTPERSAAEAARAIADLLEERGYEYAIGGALALGVAGVPRGTIDVDINVFVAQSEVEALVRTLTELGIEIDIVAALARSECDGRRRRSGGPMGRDRRSLRVEHGLTERRQVS